MICERYGVLGREGRTQRKVAECLGISGPMYSATTNENDGAIVPFIAAPVFPDIVFGNTGAAFLDLP